ncbi:hypothetical protein BaRGS_00029370 [Batillaria attramentaria]|uniref:Uncharacterized protein n=1 Tax=Batillaria attramentaria TaxID=370345 RepID=A0ABD0JWU8_9CAEN
MVARCPAVAGHIGKPEICSVYSLQANRVLLLAAPSGSLTPQENKQDRMLDLDPQETMLCLRGYHQVQPSFSLTPTTTNLVAVLRMRGICSSREVASGAGTGTTARGGVSSCQSGGCLDTPNTANVSKQALRGIDGTQCNEGSMYLSLERGQQKLEITQRADKNLSL